MALRHDINVVGPIENSGILIFPGAYGRKLPNLTKLDMGLGVSAAGGV